MAMETDMVAVQTIPYRQIYTHKANKLMSAILQQNTMGGRGGGGGCEVLHNSLQLGKHRVKDR